MSRKSAADTEVATAVSAAAQPSTPACRAPTAATAAASALATGDPPPTTDQATSWLPLATTKAVTSAAASAASAAAATALDQLEDMDTRTLLEFHE
ncbi:ice-structuring protein 4-like [Penaeus chinensis]|uniref:ice-structuring protein 4-like n=1 Tax=Penaeus chinensis TaxID=139456 RepID=UPI001FB74953|nr:ice-structuring protein 4-like [Penaeus chinensis]